MYNWTLEWTLGLVFFQVWLGCGQANEPSNHQIWWMFSASGWGKVQQLSRTPITLDGCAVHPRGARSRRKPKYLHAGAGNRASNRVKWSHLAANGGVLCSRLYRFSKWFWKPEVFQNKFEKYIVFQNNFEKTCFSKSFWKHTPAGNPNIPQKYLFKPKTDHRFTKTNPARDQNEPHRGA